MTSDHAFPNPHGIGCPWYEWAEIYGAPNVKWCEETLCAWISEPANTWSNLAFLIAAVLLWFVKTSQRKRLRIFAICLALMGIASFIYHMSNNRLTQFLDFVGMFLICFPLLFSNLTKLDVISSRWETPFSVVGTILFSALIPIFNAKKIPIQLLIAFLIVAIVSSEIKLRKIQADRPILRTKRKYFSMSVALLAVAGVCSFVDVKRIWCEPSRHIIQGHALWHCFAATSMYFAGLYHAYDEEKIKD